jgi:putative tricarboxylic transport membrane protein
MSDPESSGPSVGTRWPELLTAAVLLALAALVIVDSLRVGIGWADDGPQSGYFPFYIGLLLAASSGWIFLKQLLAWKRPDPDFAERAQIALVIAVLIPMLIYVGLIFVLGIYLASALLIGYFMLRYGKYKLQLTLPVAIGVPLIFFLVFERWFLVPLPKGPIENLLGF